MRRFLLILITIFIFKHSFAQNIRFAWITDTHIGSPSANIDLSNVIDDINGKNPDFTIATGDITERGFNSELKEAKEILLKLNRPLFLILGNHDTKWSESGCTKFKELFGDDKFYFKYKDYVFIGLNTGIPLRGGGGHFAPQDLIWLDKKLSVLPIESKIIFACHHQPDNEVDNWYEITNRLSKFNLAFIIVGHGHNNRRYNFAGIPGAMGRSTLSRNKSWGYNVIEISDDKINLTEINSDTSFTWLDYNIQATNETSVTPIPKFEGSQDISINMIYDSKTTLAQAATYKENKIFFADLEGNIFSTNLKGDFIWKQKENTSFYSKPIFVKGQLVLGGTDGNLYFYNFKTGDFKRKINVEASIISTPIFDKDSNQLIVFSNNGNVNYISLRNFSVTSKNLSGKNFESIPLKFGKNIFVGSWDNYFYSIPTKTSDEKIYSWKWTENKNFYYSPAASQPVTDGEMIYVSTPDKYVSAIDINTGQTIWRTNEYNSWESIGISKDKTKLFVKGVSDTVYCISISNKSQKLLWKVDLDLGIDTNPTKILERNNKIYISTKKGFVYSLSSANGEIIWKAFLGTARVNNLELVDSNSIAATNMDGKVFLITER